MLSFGVPHIFKILAAISAIIVTSQILTTKLFIPRPRTNLVSRDRLLDTLNAVLERKLTLISAPAGFGKTTLLAEWISQNDHPVCWLSLDERDNEAKRFLRYFTFALKQIEEDLGEPALMALQSAQPLQIESFLTGLINEIAAIAQPFVAVLDDYHTITEPEIQQALIFLLDHLPQQMHLAVISRADPPWPLARLRVRGEILEVRSWDMRFTTEETASFLNHLMGLELSPEDIIALEKRTEGWIAGLQMAAISMRGREDIARFIQSFTGSHRFVVDYLVEEVLDQQPVEIRDFLLKTSILDRLIGSLCDVVVGRDDSQSILFDLEQQNLFLIPLDDQRRWYRYHHLFADLLRNHLQQTHPGDVTQLHRRASSWYGKNDLLPDAIKHALVANDIEGVIHLTSGLALDTLDYAESRELMAWTDNLSETEFNQYPWLWVVRAQAYLKIGKFELAEADLAAAEKALSVQPRSDEMRTHILGHIAAVCSYVAEIREDPLSAIQQAEDALALLPENEIKLRAYVSIRWANCLVWFGDFGKAIPAYKEAGEASKQIGDGQSAIIALSEMAVVQMFAGQLRQANRNIADICNYAQERTLRDGRQLPAMGILYRHMSHIKRELNDLPEAAKYAEQAVEICRRWGEKEALLFGLSALIRVQYIQREFEKVEQNMVEMIRIADQISPKALKQFQNWKYYYQLLQGKTAETEKWALDLGLGVEDVFDYPHRFEYQNFARLLVLKGKYSQALKIAENLIKVVKQVGDRVGAIQYHVLRAAILKEMNRSDEALDAMAEALTLARPEGYVRSILDEGRVVDDLLRLTIAKGAEVSYARKLLNAIKAEPGLDAPQVVQDEGMVDPLSERELEVLGLLSTERTTPEIADYLYISVSTVRTHTKNIYSKLDVHSRFEAIAKAKKLNLL